MRAQRRPQHSDRGSARGAPDAQTLARGPARRRSGRRLTGNARVLAAPAYERLIAAEPYLRRSIPTLIVIFLLVVAAARSMSMMAWHDDIERTARTMLGLGAAELASAMREGEKSPGDDPAASQDYLERSGVLSSLRPRHILVVTDANYRIVASVPGALDWTGKPLDGIVAGGQPLFLFGERAGVMTVSVNGHEWFAALSHIGSGRGAAALLIPKETVFAEWRRMVSLNVTLFVITSGVLIIVLYAYFSQASRAQTAGGAGPSGAPGAP